MSRLSVDGFEYSYAYNPVTAQKEKQIEAKMPSGRIRFVIGTILAVGACNKKGSAGANLGTEVVTATTVDASRKGFVHFDGQRGSMFLELGSMVGYDRSIAETKEETIGGFRGMRLNPSAKSGGKQVNLDGGPVSSALAAAFEDIDVNERNSRSAGGTKAPSMVGKLGKGSSAHRDLEWFLSATCARIDVVLVPQQKGNWYPYWEVSSGRKMAPQFRSSGVGYLRLADDVRTETYSIDFLDTRAATLGLTSFCQTSLISMPLRWESMEKDQMKNVTCHATLKLISFAGAAGETLSGSLSHTHHKKRELEKPKRSMTPFRASLRILISRGKTSKKRTCLPNSLPGLQALT